MINGDDKLSPEWCWLVAVEKNRIDIRLGSTKFLCPTY